MRLLLDTNAYSALKRGHAQVTGLVRKSEQILLSSVVVGELLYGFHNGMRFKQNFQELEDFLGNPFVVFLPVSYATADRYGRIAALLKRNGTPIPANDIWIAAHVFETGAELVSFDHHFSTIENLPVIVPG